MFCCRCGFLGQVGLVWVSLKIFELTGFQGPDVTCSVINKHVIKNLLLQTCKDVISITELCNNTVFRIFFSKDVFSFGGFLCQWNLGFFCICNGVQLLNNFFSKINDVSLCDPVWFSLSWVSSSFYRNAMTYLRITVSNMLGFLQKLPGKNKSCFVTINKRRNVCLPLLDYEFYCIHFAGY